MTYCDSGKYCNDSNCQKKHDCFNLEYCNDCRIKNCIGRGYHFSKPVNCKHDLECTEPMCIDNHCNSICKPGGQLEKVLNKLIDDHKFKEALNCRFKIDFLNARFISKRQAAVRNQAKRMTCVGSHTNFSVLVPNAKISK